MDASQLHSEIADAAERALDPAAALDFVSDPAFGGITMFVGRIRDHNVGRDVIGISYDMFDALVLNVIADTARAAIDDVGPRMKLYAGHAKGRLAVGDIAVVVAAGTPHRNEAFRACRAMIEAIKHAAPIWKQEHYVDGSSEWSEGCSLCHADAHAAHAR